MDEVYKFIGYTTGRLGGVSVSDEVDIFIVSTREGGRLKISWVDFGAGSTYL